MYCIKSIIEKLIHSMIPSVFIWFMFLCLESKNFRVELPDRSSYYTFTSSIIQCRSITQTFAFTSTNHQSFRTTMLLQTYIFFGIFKYHLSHSSRILYSIYSFTTMHATKLLQLFHISLQREDIESARTVYYVKVKKTARCTLFL